MAINLNKTRDVVEECLGALDDLNGRRHDDPDDCGTRSERHERAATSRQLHFLATRLELAAALVRSEYWTAKGFPDHINPKG